MEYQTLIVADRIQLDQKVVEQVQTVTLVARLTSLVDLVVVHLKTIQVQEIK